MREIMDKGAQPEEDTTDENNVFQNTIPLVKDIFHIYGKVGEGTFSSVYLATLKSSDDSSTAPSSNHKKKRFALKHLIPTRHPEKIERELQCMQRIGGKDYVVGLELCLRNFGTVVFVMPYMRHDKFSDYVRDMTVRETKEYMIALLTALRRVHKFNIIHRDVKPSNFLYDRCNKRYLLVDFGLAQEYNTEEKKSAAAAAAAAAETTNTTIRAVKRKRVMDENNVDFSFTKTTTRRKDAEKKTAAAASCYCFGKPRVCLICMSRPEQTAPRAGTPGFRAPEVLLKHPSQTPAIDIWAGGVMMLSILSGTQPFFHSPDDCTALAEITTIFGSNKMQRCARKLGKKIIFDKDIPEIDITSLCQKLQKRNKNSFDHKDHDTYTKKVSSSSSSSDTQFPKEAYDLLLKLLDVDHETRITADQALNHPFLKT